MARHYVIARFEEPEINIGGDCEHTVIHKCFDIPNIGREASSWLLWILNNYSDLPDQITFLQGNPFDHTTMEEITEPLDTHYKRHGQLLECDQYGNPHHGGLKLAQPLSIMGINTHHPIKFCMGAQFTVSKERLLKYSYGQYAKLFEYSINEPNAPWELERCWETLYNN